MSQFIVPAVSLGSALLGKGGGSGSPAAQGLGAAVPGIINQSQFFSQTGQPLLSQAAQYYRNLLTGSKATIAQTLAPQINATTDLARGAKSAIDYSMRGPQRDTAEANLARDEAGRLGALPMEARSQAAGQAASLGMESSQFGGKLLSSLVDPGEKAREFDVNQSQEFGSSVGGLVGQLGKLFYGKFGPKGYNALSTPDKTAIGTGSTF